MSSELSSSPGLRPGDARAARADRAAIVVVGAGLQALFLLSVPSGCVSWSWRVTGPC
ncbi:MAG: hypothetical protein WBN89_05190 [Prochlorococcaceae cyanobacterium]